MSNCSVYRFYDKNRMIIYIGITNRGMARGDEHHYRAEWWAFVRYQEVEHFSTREDARAREYELIRKYRPPFNRQHNPGWARTRAAYLEIEKLWHLSPTDAFRAAGRRIRLDYVERTGPDRWEFRTDPAAYMVVPHLRFVKGAIALHGKKIGDVQNVIPNGMFASVVIVGKSAIGRHGGGEALLKLNEFGKKIHIGQVTFRVAVSA